MTHVQEIFDDPQDAYTDYWYCVECFSNWKDISISKAWKLILNEEPTVTHGRARDRCWKEANDNNAKLFDGFSNGQIIEISRDELRDCIQPVMQFIERQLLQLKALRMITVEHYSRLDELAAVSNDAKDFNMLQLRIIERLEEVQKRLKLGVKPLAFRNMPNQHEIMNCAQYYDEWVDSPTHKLRAFCICLADGKGTWSKICGTVTPSKFWPRKFAGPAWRKGQKHYCISCTVKYLHKFGMPVEIYHNTTSTSISMMAETSEKGH